MWSWSPPCVCCGVQDYLGVPPETKEYVCGFCRRRDRKCQHNLFTRVAEGETPFAASSRPVYA